MAILHHISSTNEFILYTLVRFIINLFDYWFLNRIVTEFQLKLIIAMHHVISNSLVSVMIRSSSLIYN